MNQIKNIIYDKDYPVTSLLFALSTLVFLAMIVLRGFSFADTQTIYDFGAVYGRTIQYYPSQIWRLLTATFVHIGFQHFIMNMVTLYFLGRQLETIFGSKKFLLLYLMSGTMGNALVLFLTPDVVAAGASTALFGMFAAVVTLRYAVRNPYIQHLGQSYLVLLVINLVFSFTPGISLAGHVGGAIGGALCAVIFPISGERNAYTASQRFLALGAYCLLLFALIGISLLMGA